MLFAQRFGQVLQAPGRAVAQQRAGDAQREWQVTAQIGEFAGQRIVGWDTGGAGHRAQQCDRFRR